MYNSFMEMQKSMIFYYFKSINLFGFQNVEQ